MCSSEAEGDEPSSAGLLCVSTVCVRLYDTENNPELLTRALCHADSRMSSCPGCYPQSNIGVFLKNSESKVTLAQLLLLALLRDPTLSLGMGCGQLSLPEPVGNSPLFPPGSPLSRCPSCLFRPVKGREEIWPEVPRPKDEF